MRRSFTSFSGGLKSPLATYLRECRPEVNQNHVCLFFFSVCNEYIYRLINIVQIDKMYCKSVSSHCPVFKIYWKFGTLPSEQARSRVSMLSIPAGRTNGEQSGIPEGT